MLIFKLWKQALISAFLLSIIAFVVGTYYESKHMEEFEQEKEKYITNWKNDVEQKKKRIEQRGIEILKIKLKIENSLNKNVKWKQYFKWKKEAMFNEMDIADDDWSAYQLEESLKEKLISDFIHSNYHRNSEERRLLRELREKRFFQETLTFHEINGICTDIPIRLIVFEKYKENLHNDLCFIQKVSPIVSASITFPASFVILMVLIMFCDIIKGNTYE